MGGWIKLHKKLKRWELYKDQVAKVLFIELLISANYKDSSWKGVQVKRGQHLTSLPSLASSLGLSEKQVRNGLQRLVRFGCISQLTTTRYRIITILNYDEYQGDDSDEIIDETAANEGQTKGQTGGQARRTNKGRLKAQPEAMNGGAEGRLKLSEGADGRADGRAALKEYKEDKEITLHNGAGNSEVLSSLYAPSSSLIDAMFSWMGHPITPLMHDDISDLITAGRADESLILEAVKISRDKGKRSWAYAHAVLNGLIGRGFTTGAEYRQSRMQLGAQAPSQRKGPRRGRDDPDFDAKINAIIAGAEKRKQEVTACSASTSNAEM